MDVVELVLSYEKVGDIAELVLSGEVSHFSAEVIGKATDGAGDEGGKDEEGKRPSEYNYDRKGSRQSLPAGKPHVPPDDTNRKQRDDDDPKNGPETFQHHRQPFPHPCRYPQFLHNVNLLTTEIGIKLIFMNTNIMDGESVFPPFMAWSETIPQPTTPIYHGSTILLDALEDFLGSFITDRVHTNRIDR